jgi:hypothetical protein
MRVQRRLSWFACALLILIGLPAQAQVLISQVYGGGGNTGGQYKNDFIELFNSGASTVNLSGWSVQYASASGTTWQLTQLTGSIGPGQYYLVQQAAGTNTAAAALPTPNATGTIAMSATNGKVALSNGIVALTGACPAAQNLVGFGSANCPTPTAVLSNSTAALRKTAGCTNTGANNADFEVLAPSPRNSASPANTCGGDPVPTDPTATATLSPSSVEVGEATLLRVTVTPGTNPTSTGIAVVADLSTIGGSATQSLFDDGSNGDVVAGDNIFSYSATVAAGTTAGTKVIGIGVGDDQLRSASLTVTLSVVQLIAIHDVQGSGLLSPYTGQIVVIEGIVTARKSNGFFLQSADADADANPATSEGVFVFTNSTPTSAATVGNRARAQGTVVEFISSSNPHQYTVTELTSPSVSALSTGNALPTATEITAAMANPGSPIDNFERLEGMRVSVASLKVVAPVGAFINEANATSPSNGAFFGVVSGVNRPYREPGVGALDTTVFPGGVNPPIFDTNPERIRIQSTGQTGAPSLGADVGDTVTGVIGVLDYGFGVYSVLPDPSAGIVITPGSTPTAVSVATSSEITIGGFNLQRFFDEVNDPSISDPVLTATALANRLKKTANAICGYVRSPDILGVVEVENLGILARLATSINTGDTLFPGSCATNPQYVAYLEEGNDIGGIDVGFLISSAEVAPGVPRVQVLEMTQIGKDTTFANPNGSTDLLNDRPSRVLRARVNSANGSHYDVTVLANHLRSLSGANSMEPGSDGWSTDGARIRAKRAAQAKFLADFVHARQTANPNERIVLLGDFNAFEFNDGYTDSMGIITGREAGPTEVLNYVDSPITTPLTNMADLSPEADRYSFSFDGNAQSLDHMVVNQTLLDSTAGVRAEHARINADFGVDNYGDFTVPVRVSDHDPVVLFLSESSFATADLATSVVASDASIEIGENAGFGVGVSNGGPDSAAPVTLDLNINAAISGLLVQPAAGWTCASPVVAAASTSVQCITASLESGASDSFVVVAPTTAQLGGSTLTLTAQVSSPMTDLATLNNQGSANVQVTANADLAASVIAPRGPVLSHKLSVFAVGVANSGPHAARGAVLAIAVNAPKAIVSSIQADDFSCANTTDTPTLSTWTCPAGSEYYAAGRSNSIKVAVNPHYASDRKALSVGASFNSLTTDPDPGNNSDAAVVRVVGPP